MSFTYSGEYTEMALFPLGGIGAGSVGLAGNGSLRDWEIFNRPNRNHVNGFSGFVIKAEADGKVLDARACQGDYYGSYVGGGDGANSGTCAGWKHFKNTEFIGKFPIAEVGMTDECFPGKLTLEAYNPFIPSNSEDSSIPCAVFKWTVENTSDREIEYTIGFNCRSMFAKSTNSFVKKDGISSIYMTTDKYNDHQALYGNMAISTDCDDVSYQEYWFRGGWFSVPNVFWNNFQTYGRLKNRHYDNAIDNQCDISTLCGSVKLCPGESKTVSFILTWYVPYVHKYWGNGRNTTEEEDIGRKDNGWDVPGWKNYYSKRFSSSLDVAYYMYENEKKLYKETKLFRDTLFASSLPETVIDAIAGNIALLKSSTCMRLENGEFYAFEGSWTHDGSCEGTCAHVWNYAYAMPFLFPDLERSIRELDYTYNTTPTGEMRFRMMLPLGRYQTGFRACVDGQMGGVMKFYREWKISGDDEWLKKYWPEVKKSLEYAWSPDNYDKWDPTKSGVITGRQHHTLDVELFGANSWLEGFYLGALKAGAEIAEYLGEYESAKEYREIFARGQKWTEENLFNGKHYIQKLDINDRELLKNYTDAENAYWDEESGEIIYQLGEGCEIDQILAQWHANLIGLGDIFSKEHCRTTLENLYRINFKKVRDEFNFCRVFGVDDEKGLIICCWDEGAFRPAITIPYTGELMTGFEYAAGDTMLMYGLEKEANDIVEGIRGRYDGKRRNPWGEIECGFSYARAMASYSYLLTYSGFEFDMRVGLLGFNPIHFEEGYTTFWAMDGAWGDFSLKDGKIVFEVKYGSITLKQFDLPERAEVKSIFLDSNVKFNVEGRRVTFEEPITVSCGKKLILR